MKNKKLWRVQNATGLVLQSLLMKLTEDGYEIEHIFEHGLMPVQTGHIVGASESTVVALFTVVASMFVTEEQFKAELARRTGRMVDPGNTDA